MILNEDPIFGRLQFGLDQSGVHDALERMMRLSGGLDWFVLGFAEPSEELRSKFLTSTTDLPVDNFFRLEPSYGFERAPAVLTLGLRASRFASILFWEAFHTLSGDGGIWIDLDYEDRCDGMEVSDLDYLERAYYQGAIDVVEKICVGPYRLTLHRKTSSSRIAPGVNDEGWTFGILTAGPSPNAARMVREILALDLPFVEVIICGPLPDDLPADPCIRHVDLEKPEPRGWITKKKNMIAEAARYENICIMHDRFFVPPQFVDAMKRYGNVFSILTFPQAYFPDRAGECVQRYADYQAIRWPGDIKRVAAGILEGHYVFNLQYRDFYETAFCCGGLYVSKKAVWNLVRQDESLYHCEWEDAFFGLESNKAGIPHRVNPYVWVESTTPHPVNGTWIPLLYPSGRMVRAYPHVSAHQRRLLNEKSDVFKPLLAATKRAYCAKLVTRFNAMPLSAKTGSLSDGELHACESLSEIWTVVYRRISAARPQTRMELFGIFALIADMIYNHAACVQQHWTREAECVLTGISAARRFSPAQMLRDAFTFSLRGLLSRIWRTVRSHRGSRELGPLLDVIAQFRETEAFYPVIFSPEPDAALTQPAVRTVPNRARLLEAEENFHTIFFHHHDGLLPLIEGWGE